MNFYIYINTCITIIQFPPSKYCRSCSIYDFVVNIIKNPSWSYGGKLRRYLRMHNVLNPTEEITFLAVRIWASEFWRDLWIRWSSVGIVSRNLSIEKFFSDSWEAKYAWISVSESTNSSTLINELWTDLP